MKSITKINADRIANDNHLSEQQAETVREAVITGAEAQLNMRAVTPIRQVGQGTQSFEYHEIDEDGSAELVAKGADYPSVTFDQDQKSVQVPINGASFELYRRDVRSAARNGTDLDTRAASRASRQVAENENDIILNGDDNLGINGLLDSVSTSISSNTSSGWSGGTVQEIQNDVVDLISNLADGLDQGMELALVVPKGPFHAAKKVDGSVNRTAVELITEEVDNFVWDPAMPSGTALLMVQDSEVAEYVMEEDLNLEEENTTNSDVMKWKVRTIGAPVIYQSGGLIEMTGI